jgi:hypothetical protein
MLDSLAKDQTRYTTAAAVEKNPVTKAILQKTATGEQNKILMYYEAAANKLAAAAVIRQRGY